MSYVLSRVMSLGTLSYSLYAFARPRHLGNAVEPKRADRYDLLATTYGARDLVISSVGIAGSGPAVGTAMTMRVALDVSDGLILARHTPDDRTRAKVLGVTLGWATLNLVALTVDRRRARRKARKDALAAGQDAVRAATRAVTR